MQAHISEIKPLDFLDQQNKCLAIFFSGCNFMCPFCNTPQMMVSKEETLLDIKDIKKQILETEEEVLLFTGGEPTLQRQALLQIAKFGKDVGKKIILHTNGSKPETIKSLALAGLIDLIVLDIKTPFQEQIFERTTKSMTFFKQTKSILEDINATLEILSENSIKTKIVTTIVPGLIFRKEDILEIARIAEKQNATLVLQQFDNSVCYDTKYMSIKPASFEFLQTLKEFIRKEYPLMNVEISAHY